MTPPRSLTFCTALLCVLLLGWTGRTSAVAQEALPASVMSMVERGEAAGASGDLLRSVARRAQANGASADATTDLLLPAVELAESGLPASPVLNKTLEGLAKRVPAPRVRSVVGTLASSIQDTGPMIDAWLSESSVQASVAAASSGRDALIVSSAHAQQRGLSKDDLKAFLNSVPGIAEKRAQNGTPPTTQQVAAAVRAMAEMPNVQNKPSLARSVVTSALSAGYSADEMGQLPAAMQRAQAQTRQPLPALTRGVANAISRGVPATDVLRGLYQGQVSNLPAAAGQGQGQGAGQGPPPGQGKPPDAGRPPDTGKPPNTPPGKPPNDPPGGGGGPPDGGGGPPGGGGGPPDGGGGPPDGGGGPPNGGGR